MKKLIIAIILLGIIQFVPYGIEHTKENVIQEPNWDSSQTKQLFLKACGDCHSNEIKYPWYADIAPISWLIQHDIKDGREHLNISVWGLQKRNKGKDAAEELEENDMPPLPYLLMHPESKLSKDERIKLINGLKNTFEK